MDEEQGIYRGEVTAIMWKLADIDVNVEKILGYIEGDDDEWEEEEDHPPDAWGKGGPGSTNSGAHAVDSTG